MVAERNEYIKLKDFLEKYEGLSYENKQNKRGTHTAQRYQWRTT